MSRFFAAHSDSETTSSSSESETEDQLRPSGRPAAAYFFSDDEDDVKRTVRSAKEKRYEELHNIMKNIRNSKKIKDFNKMETSFQELTKAYVKAKPVIAKEEKGVTPTFYIKILVEMEDLINATWEDRTGRKAMSKNNAKSLSSLRQKLRKYKKEEELEAKIQAFRENPEEEEEEQAAADDRSDSDDSDDDVRKSSSKSREASEPVDKSKFLKKMAASDDESDDDMWDSDTETSSDDDQMELNRAYFLKKTGDEEDERKREEKEKRKAERREKRRRMHESDDDDGDGDWTVVDRGAEKPKMFDKDAEINHEAVVKKLHEIMAARGKKGTNRKEQIELLTELYGISEEHDLGIAIYVKIQFAIIAAIFDYNPKISAAMKPEYWERCMPTIEKLMSMLTEAKDDITVNDKVLDEDEEYENKPFKVRGCFLTVIERMDEEFIKVLKSCDAHSNEYVDRLKDEPRVVAIIETAQQLLESSQNVDPGALCRVYLKRVGHIYFKFDPSIIQKGKDESEAKEENSLQLMDRFCKYIYSKDTTDRLRTRAILCHIYHHAIHDHWFEARDLMLMSHLQDSVMHADAATQILYNRTMVQLGLCSFRHAEIREAHNCLLDIQLGGRSKELLAQGLLPQRHNNERSIEQEKIEKQRQMPFHMHINLEMLECVYLVSAMLLEIPYMAAHEFDARRRMISKSYYQQLRSSERQALVGPPESMREHIVAASRALRNGDWKKCRNMIINDKMNAKVWDLFYEADKVRDMLTSKIKEEALRTYLFTYSKVYDSISMETLAHTYDLEKQTVHAICSKMIINEELMASLDEPSECMVMHRTEPSRLQSLSLQLADKVAQLCENNERLLEFRPGGWQSNNWHKNDSNRRGGSSRHPEWFKRSNKSKPNHRGRNAL